MGIWKKKFDTKRKAIVLAFLAGAGYSLSCSPLEPSGTPAKPPVEGLPDSVATLSFSFGDTTRLGLQEGATVDVEVAVFSVKDGVPLEVAEQTNSFVGQSLDNKDPISVPLTSIGDKVIEVSLKDGDVLLAKGRSEIITIKPGLNEITNLQVKLLQDLVNLPISVKIDGGLLTSQGATEIDPEVEAGIDSLLNNFGCTSCHATGDRNYAALADGNLSSDLNEKSRQLLAIAVSTIDGTPGVLQMPPGGDRPTETEVEKFATEVREVLEAEPATTSPVDSEALNTVITKVVLAVKSGESVTSIELALNAENGRYEGVLKDAVKGSQLEGKVTVTGKTGTGEWTDEFTVQPVELTEDLTDWSSEGKVQLPEPIVPVQIDVVE